MSSWPNVPVTDGLFGDGQLMDLGINEALPPFEVMEELYEISKAMTSTTDQLTLCTGTPHSSQPNMLIFPLSIP